METICFLPVLLSVHSSVTIFVNNEHGILKMNEQVLMHMYLLTTAWNDQQWDWGGHRSTVTWGYIYIFRCWCGGGIFLDSLSRVAFLVWFICVFCFFRVYMIYLLCIESSDILIIRRWTKELLCWLQPIVDGAFSPDGQHLASASLDGSVKFYEISQDDEPR